MEPVTQPTNGHIRELTPAEAKTLFDQEARQHFGMSGKTFIEAWEAGQFDDDPDQASNGYPSESLPLFLL